MKETGRILTIAGKTITLRGGELGGCVGCSNDACKSAGSILNAENKLNLKLAVGQLVEIDNPLGMTVQEGLIVLALPVLAAVAGYALTAYLAPASAEELRAALAVFGLAAGFLGVFLTRKLFPTKAIPLISGIVEDQA